MNLRKSIALFVSLGVALVSSQAAAAIQAPLQTTPSGETFSRDVGKTDSFGDTTFGAGYDVGASIFAGKKARITGSLADLILACGGTIHLADCMSDLDFCPAHPSLCTIDQGVLEAEGHLKADATLFGSTSSLVDIEAHARSVHNVSASTSVHYFVLGQETYDASANGPLTYDRHWGTQFLSASQVFWAGPVPITLKITINGDLDLHVVAGATTSGLSLSVQPEAHAYGVASATVNVLVAKGGVTATLTFVDAQVPSTAALTLNPTNALTWSLDSDLTVSTLDGHVDIWGQLIGGDVHTANIASWNGLTTTLPLLHKTGSFQLQ